MFDLLSMRSARFELTANHIRAHSTGTPTIVTFQIGLGHSARSWCRPNEKRALKKIHWGAKALYGRVQANAGNDQINSCRSGVLLRERDTASAL